MYVLVTFCNQLPSPQLAAAVIDTSSDAVQWLALPDGFVKGATGISPYDGGVFVACQAGGIVKYDDKLEPRAFLPTPEANSLHSILFRPGERGLYVVSTGTDAVYRYQLDETLSRVTSTDVAYCADPAGPLGDRHHMNSIVEFDGEIYVSMFGVASGPNHLTRRRGRIVRISDGEAIAEDLYHPHTLYAFDDELLVVESQAHALRRVVGGPEREWPIEGGYPRGVASVGDGRHLWLGTSARRRQSASLGTPNDTAGTEPVDFRCRLIQFDLDEGRTVHEVDLTSLAVEIFDIHPLPDTFSMQPSPERGLQDRVEALQQSYATARREVWTLERELDKTLKRRVEHGWAGARRRATRWLARARNRRA
jgi:hypothetical protein